MSRSVEQMVPAEDLGLAVLIVGPDGGVRWATSHAARLWDAPPGGLTGRRLETLLADPEAAHQVVGAAEPARFAGLALAGASESTADGASPGGLNDAWDADVAPLPGDEPLLAVLLQPARDTAARDAERAELARLQRQLAEAEAGRRRAERVRRELVDGDGAEIIGSAAPMLAMLDRVARVAPVDSTVLIIGETGSGKELVARRIHAESARAGAPLVAVNCAAMPDALIESELFGHERGAFTGADRQRLGKFELADRGTLFLDEVAELSQAAQAKLLRVLQDGAFERVGGTQQVRVDVRVVAATHRDLARQVRRGRFREDLFYRLSVFRIDVPALRDRKDDIRPLADFLHRRHAQRMGRAVRTISDRSMRRLLAYRWPGNVRELENAIERATLLADSAIEGELEVDLPAGAGAAPLDGHDGLDGRGGHGDPEARSTPRDVLLDLTHDQLQRLQIMHALETSSYRVYGEKGAATKLELKPQTLLSRMDKLGIPRPRIARQAAKRTP